MSEEQSEGLKALNQSLNDHMKICSLKRTIKRLRVKNLNLKTEIECLTEAWVDKKMQEDRDALAKEVELLRNACKLVFDEAAHRKFLMCYRGDDFYVSLQAMEAMSEALGYRKSKKGKQS